MNIALVMYVLDGQVCVEWFAKCVADVQSHVRWMVR